VYILHFTVLKMYQITRHWDFSS